MVSAPRGYGRACAAGVAAAVAAKPRYIVFLDGDGSDCPEFMERIVSRSCTMTHDFVIGSRTRGEREPGSMNFQQIFAGRVAGLLLRLVYGVSLYRHVPVPRHSPVSARPSRDARRNLRLESRDADARGAGADCAFSRSRSTIVAGRAANPKSRARLRGTVLAGVRIRHRHFSGSHASRAAATTRGINGLWSASPPMNEAPEQMESSRRWSFLAGVLAGVIMTVVMLFSPGFSASPRPSRSLAIVSPFSSSRDRFLP